MINLDKLFTEEQKQEVAKCFGIPAKYMFPKCTNSPEVQELLDKVFIPESPTQQSIKE